MCHHPPEWLKDRDEFNDALYAKTKIQLFGHKHKTRILPIKNTLRLCAGAFHPSRDEDEWLPTYFILALKVEKRNEKRLLNILVWQREWDKENKIFELKYNSGDKEEFFSYVLPMEDWEDDKMLNKNKIENLSMRSEKSEDSIVNNLIKYKRRLIYHYLSLPHNIIQTIASNLDLLQEKDKNLTVTELYKEYFKRAEEKKQLKELWDKVFYYRQAMMEKENPFKKKGNEMKELFPDWYNLINSNSNDQLIKNRNEAIKKTLEEFGIDDILNCILLLGKENFEDEKFINKINEKFREKDSAFVITDNMAELKVLVGGILATKIDELDAEEVPIILLAIVSFFNINFKKNH